MGKSQTNERNNQSNIEQKNPGTKDHLPSDSVHMTFWKRENGARITGIVSVGAWAGWLAGW